MGKKESNPLPNFPKPPPPPPLPPRQGCKPQQSNQSPSSLHRASCAMADIQSQMEMLIENYGESNNPDELRCLARTLLDLKNKKDHLADVIMKEHNGATNKKGA